MTDATIEQVLASAQRERKLNRRVGAFFALSIALLLGAVVYVLTSYQVETACQKDSGGKECQQLKVDSDRERTPQSACVITRRAGLGCPALGQTKGLEEVVAGVVSGAISAKGGADAPGSASGGDDPSGDVRGGSGGDGGIGGGSDPPPGSSDPPGSGGSANPGGAGGPDDGDAGGGGSQGTVDQDGAIGGLTEGVGGGLEQVGETGENAVCGVAGGLTNPVLPGVCPP